MEKIFDIAKDSEKSWGVIAQGIDGNFEEVEGKIEKLGSIILGESKETTEENITTDSASYKDYKFSKAIPKGAKIITLIAPSKAGYFLRVNGELGEKYQILYSLISQRRNILAFRPMWLEIIRLCMRQAKI